MYINQMQNITLSMMQSQKKSFRFGKTFVLYNLMIDDRQLEHLETRLVYQRKNIFAVTTENFHDILL